jgi:uncharacterized membrane protein
MISMNKSIAVYNLNLPKDIKDYICSFVYFTPFQSIVRNICKYNFLVNDIKYLMRVGAYQSLVFPCSSICYYHLYDKIKLNFVMCNWCGEYIRNDTCSCHY